MKILGSLFGPIITEDFASARSGIFGNAPEATQRAASDPYFYATVTLQNVEDGSEYWVAQASSLSTVLAYGTQSGTDDIVLTNIPAYESPM